MSFKKFGFYLCLITLVLSLSLLLIRYLVSGSWFLVGSVSVFSYFILTLVAYYVTLNGMKVKNNTTFMTYVLGAMLAKLLISMVLIFIFLYSFPLQRIEFAISFLLAYLVYTSFEVYCLLRILPKKI